MFHRPTNTLANYSKVQNNTLYCASRITALKTAEILVSLFPLARFGHLTS
jgi:hypothetical protein